MSIVELVENQIKDRIIYFHMISNKNLNFDSYLKKKAVKSNSGIINSTVKQILNAKLQKFKNSNSGEILNISQSPCNSNKSFAKIDNKNNTQLYIPNVNFDKKNIFKKSFANFLKIAEELKDGEILYKI